MDQRETCRIKRRYTIHRVRPGVGLTEVDLLLGGQPAPGPARLRTVVISEVASTSAHRRSERALTAALGVSGGVR